MVLHFQLITCYIIYIRRAEASNHTYWSEPHRPSHGMYKGVMPSALFLECLKCYHFIARGLGT